MRRSKSSYDKSGGPNWLDTYADMVTLLLTFFVLLFSISTLDSQKWKVVCRSFENIAEIEEPQQFVVRPKDEDNPGEGVFKGQEESLPVNSTQDIKNFDDLYEYFKKYIKEKGLENEVQILKGDGFTYITFRNNIFFDGDSYILKPKGKEILDVLDQSFVNVTDEIGKVMFVGHTARASNDKEKANGIDSDRFLSSARATNTLVYIQRKGTMIGKTLTPIGQGEFFPIIPHDGTEETRVKNRRVEIFILKEGSDDKTYETLYKEVKEK